MKLYAQSALAGVLAIGGISSIGCTVHTHGPDVVYAQPAVGYVYDDDYYGRGHWDGDYWAWRDRDGRYYHERREFHDQRIREHVVRGGERHEQRDDHERHER